jgi:hypothetical protein
MRATVRFWNSRSQDSHAHAASGSLARKELIMMPQPVALGLTLCDYVIIEKTTEKTSLIGHFHRIRLAAFPGMAPPFSVYATLTGAEGAGRITLEIQNLRTVELLYVYEQVVQFPNRLAQVRVLFRLKQCEFPESGAYQANLLADGQWIAQQRFEVLQLNQTGENP